MKFRMSHLACALSLGMVACQTPDSSTSPDDLNRPTPLQSARTLTSSNYPAPLVNSSNPQPSDPTDRPAEDEKKRDAEAEFASVPDMKVSGEAELKETIEGVRIEVEISGAPAGKKGLHIHEKDDCSDIAGKSMGAHFNPKKMEHGLPDSSERHLGDLGNITIGEDGKGKLTIVVSTANLKPGDEMSFVGKSIVLHEGADDGKGASGNSGKPIACAPIKAD